MVELDYWLNSAECRSDSVQIMGSNEMKEDQVIQSRTEAIYALRGSELQDTEGILLDAIADSNSLIRKAGLIVLIEYSDRKYLPLIHESLHDEDEEIQQLAAEQLKLFRKLVNGSLRVNAKPSVRDCLKALEDKNDNIRERAVEALVGVIDPQIIQPLLAVMKSEKETLWCRLAAINALNIFDSSELLVEFYSILDDENVGGNAAYQLANKSNPVAYDMLLEALCSGNRQAKLSAAAAISRSADVRALIPLCQMLEDCDYVFKRVALDSISRLLHPPQDTIAGHDTDPRISEEIKVRLVASLIKATGDKNNDIRGKAIELLSAIDKSKAIPVVSGALEEFIQYALSDNYIENKDLYFDQLQSGLHTAIITLGGNIYSGPLRRLFNAKSWHVRIDAAETLLKLGDEIGVSVLKEALCNKDWIIRVNAAENLLSLGDSHVWDVLVKALVDDVDDLWFIKEGIIDSLANSGDARTFDLFIDILNNVDSYSIRDETVAKIITLLGKSGDFRAAGPIKKWQHKELINCDDDIVERALTHLALK